MGGALGGSQGTTQTTQTTTPFNSQQILALDNRAMGLPDLQYYPGQTYAPPTQNTNAGLNAQAALLQASGRAGAGLVPGSQAGAIGANANLAAGGGLNFAMPWMQNLANLAKNNPAQAGMNALNPVANGTYFNGLQPYISGLKDLTSGTAANSLARSANGEFLNSNPYLDKMFNAASSGVTRAYQNATAPQTDSAFASAGRFNSGGLGNARSVNQRDLGTSLGNMGANIYGTNYANERSLMNSAATNLGNLQTGALLGAGGLYNTGVNTLSGAASNLGQLGALGQNSQVNAANAALGNYTNLLNNQNVAIGQNPTITGMPAAAFAGQANVGNTQQAQQQAALNDAIARFYGVQNAPWATLQQQAGILSGAGSPGSSTIGTQPYFSNPLAQGLGAASGILGVGKSLLGGK